MTRSLSALIALGLLSSACVTTAPQSDLSVQGKGMGPEDYSACDIVISFGSYAMGIDGAAYDRIKQRIIVLDPKSKAYEYSWGREGEKTICLQLSDPRKANAIASDLRSLIPANPRGPISVETQADRR